MPKRWLMAILGLFLAATLIWAFPAFAQLQSGKLLKGHKQGSGTGSSSDGFGYGSTITKSQDSLGTPSLKKPDQVSNPARSNNNTHTLEKQDHQPQSQTPGGTNIP
jgi:hypothetical protein